MDATLPAEALTGRSYTASRHPQPESAPRFAVLYAGAGAGHKHAAQHVADALRDRGASVDVIDVLDELPWLVGATYAGFYRCAVRDLPFLWALVYRVTSALRPGSPVRRLWSGAERLALRGLARRLRDAQLDGVVATHFLAASAFPRSIATVQPQCFVVVTDLGAHPAWITTGQCQYFVASKESRAQFIRQGMPGDMVTVTGLPLAPDFLPPSNPPAPRSVLFVPGWARPRHAARVVEALLRIDPAVDLTVVTGGDRHIARGLERHRGRYRQLGYEATLAPHMRAAAVVVTKAGWIGAAERASPLRLPSPARGTVTL